MSANFESNITLSDKVLDSQDEDVKTTIKELKESKSDLKDKKWVQECFDVVIEAMKEKEAMQ